MMKHGNSILTRRCSVALVLLCAIASQSHSADGDAADYLTGGVKAAPSAYKVTLKKIEFRRSDNSYYTFFDGSSQFDIASASAGEAVGTFAQGASLPAGTYNQMRLTVSRIFQLTGSYADAGSGQPCRTSAGNSCSGSMGGVSSLCDGTTDGGTATEQTVYVPTGGAASTAIVAAGMEEIGDTSTGDLRFPVTMPATTVSADNTVPPSIRIDFDVADAMELLTTGVGTCELTPTPPTITVTITP